MPQVADIIAEGKRLMVICNACRYCEGFCAVFPALERRLTFSDADMDYLANLCHNCAECYYACQYAPPHEFAVNVPKVLAEIRARSYQKNAWPRFRPVSAIWAVAVGIILAAALVLLAVGGISFLGDWETGWQRLNILGFHPGDRSPTEIYLRMLPDAGVMGFGVGTFALRDGLSLKNLDSHGAGCTYPQENHSQARRWFHHLTFYGFLLCTASTTVAAFYHSIVGWSAPYPYFSVPVVLGTLGGVGLLVGPIGLYRLKQRRDTAIVDVKQDSMDVSFLMLLFLTSLTGLLLLVMRDTNAMGLLLRIHLGVVFGLCLTLPYGKFVHGIYRGAALLRSALETSRGQH